MAANDHSARLGELRALLSRLSAHRADFFALVESLERALGRDVDVRELEQRIDCELSGRSDLTDREVLSLLSTASPLRAVAAA